MEKNAVPNPARMKDASYKHYNQEFEAITLLFLILKFLNLKLFILKKTHV